MAFSGVTSVKFTAAPGRIKRTESKKERGNKEGNDREGRERMRQSIVEDSSRKLPVPVRHRSLF